jgi:hypothetical protein
LGLISVEGRGTGGRRVAAGRREVRGELIELEFPEVPVVVDPLRRFSHRRRDEHGAPHAALAPNASQAGALEDANVLGDGGQAHVEPRGEVADRAVTGREPGDDRPPRRIGKGAEGGVEGRVMVNHMV